MGTSLYGMTTLLQAVHLLLTTLVQVQDLTQAELLLDMRMVADPNRIFYGGDTAQTIARGIGFRFDGGCAHAPTGLGLHLGMQHLKKKKSGSSHDNKVICLGLKVGIFRSLMHETKP